MAKRHFLQQSHKYMPRKHDLTGMLMSEKLDGQRAYWDGGVSRGIPKSAVPWANNDKDHRYLTPPIATGLWSRYGNVIHAPAWFLDSLPPFPLDGELWVGRGQHQECRKIVSPLVADSLKWKKVKFVIFDSPAYEQIFYPSVIDLPNYKKEITEDCIDFIMKRGGKNLLPPQFAYHLVLKSLEDQDFWSDNVVMLGQTLLHHNASEAREQYENSLSAVLHLGGEGLVTRNPLSMYLPERVHHCVKHKPYHDSEGKVVGYVTGRETDKGSKLLGLMGAMIVEWRGKRFQLSGFTDHERILIDVENGWVTKKSAVDAATDWAADHPEEICPDWIEAMNFPRGSRVTFKYRELTDEGVPKEASYLRKA
jgi:DNA ligase-1